MTQSETRGLEPQGVTSRRTTLFRALVVAIAVLGISLLATAPAEAHTVSRTWPEEYGDVKVESRAQISHWSAGVKTNGRAQIFQNLYGYWQAYNSPAYSIADQVQLWYWQVPYANAFLCEYLQWQFNAQTDWERTVPTYWWGYPCGSGGTSTYYTYNGAARNIGYWVYSWAWSGGHLLPP